MRLATSLLACLLVLAPGTAAVAGQDGRGSRLASRPRTYTYSIEDGPAGSSFRPADRELAKWALQDWQRHAGGRLRFVAASRETAQIRLKFVGPLTGEYGETQRERVGNRIVAVVYIRPDTSALGPVMAEAARLDPLMRDAVVYLTCLHELGHALGLPHTADERDIMYSFGFGGDVHAFFSRYRDQLARRGDIARTTGLSDGDIAHLRATLGAR